MNSKKAVTVYIQNLTEDVIDFVKGLSKTKQTKEIAENVFLAERDLFCFPLVEPLIFILPQPVDADFLAYYQELFGRKTVPHIIIPHRHSGAISYDVRKDPKAFSHLTEIINNYGDASFSSYSKSQDFHKLIEEIKKININAFVSDGGNGEQAKLIAHYGTKSGMRRLYNSAINTKHAFAMSSGTIFKNKSDAIAFALNEYLKKHAVVIKIEKGHSGMGVLIYGPNELPADSKEIKKRLSKDLSDPFWSKHEIVVEDYVEADLSIGGGFPSVEFYITDTGPEYLYIGGMRVTKEGVFKGMEVHDHVLPPDIQKESIRQARNVSQLLFEKGIRGYHDVDQIISKDRKIYITEANIRRTGATHVHMTAQALFGKDYQSKIVAYSNNLYEFNKLNKPSFVQMYKHLRSLLFDPQTKEGVIICSSATLERNMLTYVLLAQNVKRANEIERKLEKLLRN